MAVAFLIVCDSLFQAFETTSDIHWPPVFNGSGAALPGLHHVTIRAVVDPDWSSGGMFSSQLDSFPTDGG